MELSFSSTRGCVVWVGKNILLNSEFRDSGDGSAVIGVAEAVIAAWQNSGNCKANDLR